MLGGADSPAAKALRRDARGGGSVLCEPQNADHNERALCEVNADEKQSPLAFVTRVPSSRSRALLQIIDARRSRNEARFSPPPPMPRLPTS